MNKMRQNTKKDEIAPIFDWLSKMFVTNILGACQEFWEDNFELSLKSVTENGNIENDILIQGESFYNYEIEKNPNQKIIIRLSSNFVGIFLHIYLASSKPTFNLKELSPLEVEVLDNFLKFVYEKINTFFIDYTDLSKDLQRLKGWYNLTFLIRKRGFPPGKITLTIPKNICTPKKIKTEQNFSFRDFVFATTLVNLKFGTTKITLNDLKGLVKGDILLLENSSINTVRIKTANIEQEFKVSPDPSLIIDLSEIDGHNIEGDNMTKNIWDDIQIEVSAEFNKVKMTLGELKQLTSGLVIDLGDIFDNKISLVVEEKVVAKGELVIINDKYGVRIDEIISDDDIKEEGAIKTNIATKENPNQSANKRDETKKKQVKEIMEDIDEDEDFDYSNMEDDKE